MTSSHWYEDQDNLLAFLNWMASEHSDASSIVNIVEKPWKWDNEYRLFGLSDKSNSPWQLACPNCGCEQSTTDQDDIDWLDGSTFVVCQNGDCDTYMTVKAE